MQVLKFGAIWCPGCLVMRPRWQQIEQNNPELKTIYYDYDLNREEVDHWQIGKILPVAVFIDSNNQEILRLIGEQSKDKLIKIIEELKNR